MKTPAVRNQRRISKPPARAAEDRPVALSPGSLDLVEHTEPHPELGDRHRPFDAEERGARRLECTQPPGAHRGRANPVPDEDPAQQPFATSGLADEAPVAE